MNRCILIGRIGVEPKSKDNYCQIRLAVDNHFKNKAGEKITNSEWFNCVGFGDIGNNMSKVLSVGDLVKFEGRLQSSKYTDSHGNKRTSWSVITDSFERVSSPNTERSDNHADSSYTHTRVN